MMRIFSGSLKSVCSKNCESSASAVRFYRAYKEKVTGDMAEWLGRGLQNLVRRFKSACRLRLIYCFTLPRSSRGLGRRPFTAVTRVQIPYAVLFYFLMEPIAQSVRAPGCGPGGRGFEPHWAPIFCWLIHSVRESIIYTASWGRRVPPKGCLWQNPIGLPLFLLHTFFSEP